MEVSPGSSPEDDFFSREASSFLGRRGSAQGQVHRPGEQPFRFGASTPQNSPVQLSLDEQMSYKLNNLTLGSSPQYFSTSPNPMGNNYLDTEMGVRYSEGRRY
eukprot:TRINITY_DN479_c0_g1_i1.p1 TRINITY_DN479_c0_g1~~TRINITY_DN479_c0_g1_i1.p1  ORF type:complete len:103 (-),score=11.68 TRINITY_DN479_c0_g1_i1:282-590(-)